MIKRTYWLNKLKNLQDKNVIKVITGIRRSGKSVLLKQFQDELKKTGITSKNIISINFEEMENEYLCNRYTLNDYIIEKYDARKKHYVFLDEIQNVPEFEKLIASLFVKKNIDLYITGSNANMLSSEIATFLSGRYIELQIQPFTFYEFSQNYKKNIQKEKIFSDYFQYGGFPEVSNFLHNNAISEIPDYLNNIYKTVLEKDIIKRGKIKSKTSFNNVLMFIEDQIGSILSPNNIANKLKAENKEVNKGTVDNYITLLSESYILYKVNRYDIKGKKLLETLNKYYSVDIGLSRILLGKNYNIDRGHILENIVYLELLSRGYNVQIGKYYNSEIDFICQKPGFSIEYYQVTETLLDKKTRERELSSFQKIKDNNIKTVLSMDNYSGNHTENYDGIIHKNIISWLLDKPR